MCTWIEIKRRFKNTSGSSFSILGRKTPTRENLSSKLGPFFNKRKHSSNNFYGSPKSLFSTIINPTLFHAQSNFLYCVILTYQGKEELFITIVSTRFAFPNLRADRKLIFAMFQVENSNCLFNWKSVRKWENMGKLCS